MVSCAQREAKKEVLGLTAVQKAPTVLVVSRLSAQLVTMEPKRELLLRQLDVPSVQLVTTVMQALQISSLFHVQKEDTVRRVQLSLLVQLVLSTISSMERVPLTADPVLQARLAMR